MLKPIYTRQFAKDLKRMRNRGKRAEKIRKIITNLVNDVPLDAKHRDHSNVLKIEESAILSQIGY